MMTEHAREGSPSLLLLAAIYVALIACLALTIFAAHLSLGALALVVALAIAGIKAALVVLYFMHVRYAARVTWIFVLAGLLWLTIMFGLTWSEYWGRTTIARAQPLHPTPSALAPAS